MDFRRSSFSKKQRDSFSQMESTSSLISPRDNQFALNESFVSSFRLTVKERQKEILEQIQFKKYSTKLKYCSTFFLFFAIFILLNSCIGFSSAPFYEHDTGCKRADMTVSCKPLQTLVSFLYAFEMIGSLILCVQGLLLFGLADHIKFIKLARCIQTFTKIVLVLYLLIIICRIGLYLKIHYDVLQNDPNDLD